jgi:hypothetical protein
MSAAADHESMERSVSSRSSGLLLLSSGLQHGVRNIVSGEVAADVGDREHLAARRPGDRGSLVLRSGDGPVRSRCPVAASKIATFAPSGPAIRWPPGSQTEADKRDTRRR